jgi:hypothetical protein
MQRCVSAPEQVRPDDVWRRQVNEIPVVHACGAAQIESIDRRTLARRSTLEGIDEQQEREKPRLVPRIGEQRLHVLERESAKLARDSAKFWKPNP